MAEAENNDARDGEALRSLSGSAGKVGYLVAVRSVSVGLSLVFGIVMARFMGPQLLGEFGLLRALAGWFVVAGTLGGNQVMLRFGPEIRRERGEKGLRDAFGALLGMRILSGLFFAALYLLIFTVWFREIAPSLVILMAAAFVTQLLSNLVFVTLLGMHRIRLWGSLPMLRSVLKLALVPPAFAWRGITGACTAILICRFAVLASGLCWTRSRLSPPSLNFGLVAPYLRFGMTVYVTSLLRAALFASGVVLVRITTDDYREVGYFGIAMAVFGDAAFLLPRLVSTFIPSLTALKLRGREDELKRNLSKILGLFTAGSVILGFALALPVRHGLPSLLRREFEPAMVSLLPMAAALVVLVPFSVSRLLAVVYEEKRSILTAEIVRLAVFWSVGLVTTATWGSLGAAIAFAVAATVSAGILTAAVRKATGFSSARWFAIAGFGSLFAPIVAVPENFGEALIAFGIITILFSVGLFALRLLTRDDFREVAANADPVIGEPGNGPD